jgi:hypothetical protein
MRPFALLVASGLSVGLSARVASAEDGADATRAAALFDEGRRLMATDDYGAACPKLAESQALDPRPDTALDLGLCYQRASQAAFKVSRDLAPNSRIPVASPIPASPATEAASDGQTQRIVGWTLGGVGVAAIVTGIVTGLSAKAKDDQAVAASNAGGCAACGQPEHNAALGLATASTVSFVVGILGVGAGAIVFFTAPKSKDGASATLAIAPAAEGARLVFAGRF